MVVDTQPFRTNSCLTLQMLHAVEEGWYRDRRDGHKKSAARRGRAALLLELALNTPLCRKGVERMSERSTDAKYGLVY